MVPIHLNPRSEIFCVIAKGLSTDNIAIGNAIFSPAIVHSTNLKTHPFIPKVAEKVLMGFEDHGTGRKQRHQALYDTKSVASS
jgi:hypothetical protein